ncbi:MAG: hypothetical protein DMF82_22235 [Acidobacteria bacterium]|nr:MAG: hypothetical protein DMF82_22235 [Acidobacteriota bacterium]
MDYALKGVANEFAARPPVRVFVMGENAWRDETEFPPARARATRYYLQPGSGRADGMLVEKAPGSARAQSYDYDPDDPAPTLGGRLCCGDLYPPGPADQRPLESRPDVLVFSTPPLARDVEATGWLSLELFAATSAVDTDFTAVLADVDEAGYARFLTDGVVRGRYRDSTAAASLLQPGRVYKYAIDLQQLPPLRPQPEHGRADPGGRPLDDYPPDRLPRPRPPLGPGAAGGSTLSRPDSAIRVPGLDGPLTAEQNQK